MTVAGATIGATIGTAHVPSGRHARGRASTTVTSKAILWDFDGTLARRTGLWSDLLIQLLDAEQPDHGYVAAQFRDAMRTGFPWHDWERPHPDVVTSEAWWSALGQVVERVLIDAGVGPRVERPNPRGRGTRVVRGGAPP